MGAKVEENEENDEEESDNEAKKVDKYILLKFKILKEYEEKDVRYPPLENRVFVCIGTSKFTKYIILTVFY